MSELTELGKILHEQHFRILVLVSGLENRIRGEAATRPLDVNTESDRSLLEELVSSLSGAIEHNAFEEKVLFPLLCRHGEGELAELLSHEHLTIGPVVRQVQMLASELLMNSSNPSRWQEFRQAAETLVNETLSHLQKEEIMVVQRLGFFLDAETDRRLARSFGAGMVQPELPTVAVPAVEPMPMSPETLAPVTIRNTSSTPASVSLTFRPASVSTAARLAARRRSTMPRHP